MVTIRLKEICKEKGTTLNDLSAVVGISRVSLSGIATGKQKPSLDTLEKLADALGVSIGELFAAKPSNTIVCPKCGAALEVVVRE